MAACSDPTYEPGPVAPLDESALTGPLEPPTLTPIAQSFADQSGPWLTTLDAAYGALELETTIDLAGTLGDAGSDVLAGNGFTGVTASAPVPRIARTSTVVGASGPATLAIVVTDASSGGVLPGADVVVLQTSNPVVDTSADSQGRAVVAVTTGPVTIIVSEAGYVQQLFSVQVLGDTTVTVALVGGTSTPVQGDVADQASQLAVLHDSLIGLDGDMRKYWTFTGGNPHP